jgi:alkaline phosphatase D
VRSTTESDLTAVATLEGLKPLTKYRYAILLNAVDDKTRERFQSFTTAPPLGATAKFSIAFGGCAGYTPTNEHMWDTIRSFKPQAMWFLGDNEYIDQPTMPALQYYCFYRRQARPEFRRLVAGTPVYAIWDDHDFGANDGAGGPDVDDPPWKRAVWNVFRQTWVNPSYGGGEKQPGCWFDYQYGDVHFIFLDGRYYRSTKEQGVDPPTMLGPAQKQWLFEKLAASNAKIKVLVSPVAWSLETKGESPDTWNGFQQERSEIFNYLADHNVTGVVLVSSDRHRSDLLKNERPNGYTLHEFNSGLLTNDSVHPTLPTAEFSYNEHPCFGLLTFDTISRDAAVTYRIIDINGQEHLKFTVYENDLR